nr:MFS transporter [Nesterenkonia sp.]
MWTHLGAALGMLAVPLLALTGHLTLPLLAVALFAVGVLSVFSAAAEQSIIPDLVPRPLLVTANARFGQSGTVAQTSGPAVGGALVSWISAPATLLIAALSHLAAALLMTTVQVQERRTDGPAGSRVLRSIGQGLAFVYRHRTLAPLGISTHIWFIANSAAMTVFALYALRELGLSPVLYGVMLACVGVGVGGLLGAFCAPAAVRRLGEGRTILIGKTITPLAWIGVALVPHAEPWAVVCLAGAKMLYGFSIGFEDPAELGYRQAVTAPSMLGRLNATMRSANRTMAVVGSLLGGVLAGLLGYRVTIWWMILIFAVAVVVVLATPLRTARAPQD